MSEVVEKKRGRGRPSLGVKTHGVKLTDEQWTWLENRPGGASAQVREWIERAMEVEEVAVREAKASGAYAKALKAHDAACKRHDLYPRNEFDGPLLAPSEYDLVTTPTEKWDDLAKQYAQSKS